MLYLIGGSPRSGKTTFAKLLAQKLNCKLISLDNVRKEEVVKIGTKKAKEVFIFDRLYENNDDFFQKYSPPEILKIEIEDAKALWPRTEEIITEKIKQNKNTIIEGVQMFPEFLEKYKNNPNIKILLFYKKDKQLILEGFHKNNDTADWLLNDTKNPETFEKVAEAYVLYGNFFETEARKYNFEAINTEQDFAATLKKILDNIV